MVMTGLSLVLKGLPSSKTMSHSSHNYDPRASDKQKKAKKCPQKCPTPRDIWPAQ